MLYGVLAEVSIIVFKFKEKLHWVYDKFPFSI